jgi:quinol monooxygenase YgiN
MLKRLAGRDSSLIYKISSRLTSLVTLWGKELRAKSIQEKGNLFYQVHQDNSDPNTLILFEGYSDDAALTLHRNAGYYIQAVAEGIRPLLADREVIVTRPVEI